MYVLFTGDISNAGDFLIKEKAIELLKFFKPKRKIITIDRWKTLTEKMKKSKELSRSLFVVKDIKAGEVFTEENIRSIRPGYGLLPKYLKDILVKRDTQDIKKGASLSWELIKNK